MTATSLGAVAAYLRAWRASEPCRYQSDSTSTVGRAQKAHVQAPRTVESQTASARAQGQGMPSGQTVKPHLK